MGQRRSRTIRNSVSEGKWTTCLVSSVRRKLHLSYRAMARLLVDVTHSDKLVARSTFACPPHDRVHESHADSGPARLRGDEHTHEQGPGIVRLLRVAGKTSCDPDPLSLLLGDKSHTVGSDSPALGPLMPYTFRKFLLMRQRRAKRCRRICEGAHSNGSQFQAFICANPPNL
jgi:hypothetical protein